METTKRFGDVVARLRREKGLTQEQLAACVGVSAPAVSKWETGGSVVSRVLRKLVCSPWRE